MKRSDQDGHLPRVLLVDDDDDLADALRQSLHDAGFAIATVRHGAAALELIGQIEPDVILLDLTMPIMDGWSFAEQYRRQAKPPASLILVSAMKDIEESARRIGAATFIQKPFELTDVLSKIDHCIAAS